MTCVCFPTKTPLGKPLKNQKFMADLKELISFLPEDWKDSFEIKSDNPLVTKLLTEILFEAIKTAPVLISDLDSEKKKTTGLFKELNHINRRKLEAYADGVSDSIERLVDTEVRTPTARDALLDAVVRIEELLVKEGYSDEETP